MGKSKTQTPAAPDYTSLAKEQGAASKDAWQTNLTTNRPNQSNQYGSSSWSQDPANGQWTQSTQLNGPQQDIFNSQQGNQQQVANMAGGMLGNFDTSQISTDGMPKVGQYNQQATDLYNKLAQPELDRRLAARRAQASAMGISDLTSQAGTNLEQQLADQTSRSGMMGAQAGIDQGNKMFSQGMDAYQQGINTRKANLSQLQGLMGLGQQVGTPQFGNFYTSGQYNVPDLMGAASKGYDAQLNTTNAANADKSNAMSTLGTIASVGATLY